MALVYQEAGVDLAFPGAEGEGRFATINWDVATVLEVLNLNNAGAGSLRAAIEANIADSLIAFRTSGTILTDSVLRRDAATGLYIAGQTAADTGGDGICIRNKITNNDPLLSLQFSDIIVRHIRVRAQEPDTQTPSQDCIEIHAPSGVNVEDIIVANCEGSWATDGTFDITAGSGRSIKKVTIQNSWMYEHLADARLSPPGDPAVNVHGTSPPGDPHSLIMSIGDNHDLISIINNLFAHASGRMPRVAGGLSATSCHVAQNLCYSSNHNWFQWRNTDNFDSLTNYVRNYMKEGPNDDTAQPYIIFHTPDAGANSEFFIDDGGPDANTLEDDTGAVIDQPTYAVFSNNGPTGDLAASGFTPTGVITRTPADAYDYVRANGGCGGLSATGLYGALDFDAARDRIWTQVAARGVVGSGVVVDTAGTLPTLAVGVPPTITGEGKIPDVIISGWGLEVGPNWDRVKDTRGRTYLQIYVERDIPERIITLPPAPPETGPKYGQTIVVTTAGPGYGAQSGDL